MSSVAGVVNVNDHGLASLGPEAVAVLGLLERRFLDWARECGAEPWLFPPLMPVASLEKLDYFQNFPHLGLVVTRAAPDRLEALATRRGGDDIPVPFLEAGEFLLPSAACYSVYLHMHGRVLHAPAYVTTVARCFRNEERYEGLKRLWGFTMREIVCVGSSSDVRSHLDAFKTRVLLFGESIGLPLAIQAATDPFYDKKGSRAMAQKTAPVKEEFVWGGVAIASVNVHRNFFGERCEIRMADGSYAFSGCAAFGLERWLHALLDRYTGDFCAITRALDGGA